jgi:hypothetical protein
MIYFLWTCPRSMSSLVERIVMNMNIQCIHEPFSIPYYFGPDKKSDRYEINDIYLDNTFTKTINNIIELNNKDKKIFVKDMAYYIDYNFKEIDKLFKDSKHSYLIRPPNESITSLYNMSIKNINTKWNTFNKKECGYEELYELYKKYPGPIFQTNNICEPTKFIKDLCDFLDIEYSNEFLSWDPLINIGIPNDWKIWIPWHESVINSTHVEIKEFKKEKRKIPNHLISIINENNNYYKKLLKNKIINQK